ncbi:MAG TPA: lysophospholipid acyltransferase family protein [Myxococcota bacterium]|nr:lysophospholipid acyltransferase family protein [Myxococcota bacterium]
MSNSARLRSARRRAATALAATGAAALTALPERLAIPLGAALGGTAARCFRRRTREALANLRLVFPERSEAERAAIWRSSCAELGRCAVEWARLPSLSTEVLLERVEVVGLEHLAKAAELGRGVFAITAHYGNFEYIPAVVRARLPGASISVVGRTMPTPGMQTMIERRRIRGGGEVIPQDARAILRALREGTIIGILIDHYTRERRGGVLVPFLGVRAWTTAGPALLALRTGAPAVPLHIHRLRNGHHRIHVEPALELPQSRDRERDVAAATALMNEAVGRWIREDPVPWTWSHRRFRHSPDAELRESRR